MHQFMKMIVDHSTVKIIFTIIKYSNAFCQTVFISFRL